MRYQPNKKVIEVYSKRAGKDVKYFEFLKSCLSNDLELENGLVLQFEKPRIKTDFCYGYSLYGCNTESYDNATESVEHAKNDIVHFIDANIHESMIKYYYDKFKKAEQVFYSASKDGLLSLDQLSDQEDKRDYQYEYGESPRYKEYINGELSKSDIQKILAVLAEELQKFVKRLNTYLKRYGLSKVHSWSYWRDE